MKAHSMTGCGMTLAMALALAAPAEAATLVTPYDADNFNDGVMFDVATTRAVTLTGIGVNAYEGTYDYAIYYRAGGVGAATTDASAWTLLGTWRATTTAGSGNTTAFAFTGLGLAAGQTYGFYVTDTQGAFSINYTNSDRAVGSTLASDAALSVKVGYGVAYPFADPVAQRSFNGALTYAEATAVPEPQSWALMIAGFGIAGGMMRRRARRVAFA